ncbi:MAG: hypothetical protein BMS9Abin08_0684 [Gammaproteobacteria bacterium]|nr:MAG: hypothetical protein BMS9Abin08_0684 [Gammaproteobacteria bacterium]
MECMNDDAPSQNSDDPLIECLTFTLGNEAYGIDVLYVQEVLRSPVIEPVPGSPSHVLGIINLHDKVIAVNDMRTMLGLPSVETTERGAYPADRIERLCARYAGGRGGRNCKVQGIGHRG